MCEGLLRLIGGVTHPGKAGSLTVGCAPSKAQCGENRSDGINRRWGLLEKSGVTYGEFYARG